MAAVSLRERKKEMIRQEVIRTAERLFEERGYDAVTVAEIADAANISVKTIFTYFRSKEDLLFQDSSLIDAIVADLKSRTKDESPARTVTGTLIRLLKENGAPADSLAAFQKGYGSSEVLSVRLLKLWADYEDAIAGQLATEQGLKKPTVDIRYVSAQVVTLIRAVTWKEMHEMIAKKRSGSHSALSAWLEKKATIIDNIA